MTEMGCKMARPPITKRVCKQPANVGFTPIGRDEIAGVVSITVDEYETIRLIDLEGVSREECARRMDIARTTAQGIYNSAKVKIADSIVHGKELHIEGGAFSLCDGSAECPECGKKKLVVE